MKGDFKQFSLQSHYSLSHVRPCLKKVLCTKSNCALSSFPQKTLDDNRYKICRNRISPPEFHCCLNSFVEKPNRIYPP